MSRNTSRCLREVEDAAAYVAEYATTLAARAAEARVRAGPDDADWEAEAAAHHVRLAIRELQRVAGFLSELSRT